jgi:anti-sigma factor RsiW
MTCKQLVERLYDFIQGELEEELSRHMQEHLQCCSHCVTYVKTYQITIHLSRRLPASPVPDQLLERLRAVLKDLDSRS